jgi:CRP-like cAMP-binding protein
VIVRQGETGDDMYLIESGTAEVRISQGLAEGVTVATLGPGDFFGEIALLTGEERIADVVAAEPMTLLRLNRDSYDRYLAHAAEVEQQMTRAAMSRTRETTRRMISGN